jgi:hypothetical protein
MMNSLQVSKAEKGTKLACHSRELLNALVCVCFAFSPLAARAALVPTALSATAAQNSQKAMQSNDFLIHTVASEIARLKPLVDKNPSDGSLLDQLELKAFPSTEELGKRLLIAGEFDRSSALDMVWVINSMMKIDSGRAEAELLYPLRHRTAIVQLLAQCHAGKETSAVPIADQGEISRLGLPPLSEGDVCTIKSLLENYEYSINHGQG